MKKYKVILFGLGDVGYKYDVSNPEYRLTHYNTLVNDRRFELVGCVDPKVPISWNYDVPIWKDQSNCDQKADIYVIAVPTYEHVSSVENVICKAGCKLIFLEKPGGASLAETNYIQVLSQRYNVPILINLFRDVEAKNTAAQLEPLGEIKKVGIEYTGTLNNIGIHFLSFIEKVIGKNISFFQKNQGDNFQSYSFQIGDIPVFVVENSNTMPLNNEVVFLCENGKMIYLNDNNTVNIYEKRPSRIFPCEASYELVASHSLCIESSLSRVYDNIVKFLQLGKCQLRTIEELSVLKRSINHE